MKVTTKNDFSAAGTGHRNGGDRANAQKSVCAATANISAYK